MRYRSLTASRISPVYWPYIHGSVTVLSVFTECTENLGWKMPFCTQRTISSASGAGP